MVAPCAVWGCPDEAQVPWCTGDTASQLLEWEICLRHYRDLLARAPCTVRKAQSPSRWLVIARPAGVDDSWPEIAEEIEDLAQVRDGSYDVRAIIADIEHTFGPSSLREIPVEEVERLFQVHRS